MALALAGTVGCRVGEPYERPSLTDRAPEQWRTTPAETAKPTEGPPHLQWWQRFDDPVLERLIRRAVDDNPTLAEVRERIVEARARRGVAAAKRLPDVEAQGRYRYAESGDEAITKPFRQAGRETDVYAVGVPVRWELDLWGRVESLEAAAERRIEARQELWRDAAVSLAADVSHAYIRIRVLEKRMAVLDEIIAVVEQTLELRRSLFEAGAGTELAAARAEQALDRSRARKPGLRQAKTQAENRLATLVGTPPRDTLVPCGDIPRVPTALGTGIPANLVTRRPDIRAAEREYAAAAARVNAAKASRYPAVRLGGDFFLAAGQLDSLFNRETKILSVKPSVAFPLFTGGRLENRVAVRTSQQEQARWRLRQAVLAAVLEVENAAAAVVYSAQRRTKRAGALENARRREELTQNAYEAGVGNRLQVLGARRERLADQDRLLTARGDALVGIVQLYRSLGGGWKDKTP